MHFQRLGIGEEKEGAYNSHSYIQSIRLDLYNNRGLYILGSSECIGLVQCRIECEKKKSSCARHVLIV